MEIRGDNSLSASRQQGHVTGPMDARLTVIG